MMMPKILFPVTMVFLLLSLDWRRLLVVDAVVFGHLLKSFLGVLPVVPVMVVAIPERAGPAWWVKVSEAVRARRWTPAAVVVVRVVRAQIHLQRTEVETVV